MYRVLLISYVNWDSLIEIPVILTNAGCAVDIFSVKDSWVLQNKYHDSWIEGNADATAFLDELLSYIDKNAGKYNHIIPGDDAILRALNGRITDPSLFYKVMPLTKIEHRQLLGSKAGFSELCAKYNIRSPRYLIYDAALTLARIGEYLGYPLLMKLDKSEGGFGVYLCENEQALAERLASTPDKNKLVFQQFIKGCDINTEVLYHHGELLVYSYSRTLMVMGKFGVSTQRLFYQNNEVEEVLINMGRSLGLSGFGNVVFMYSEQEKQHYLIEIDMRPNAWTYYGRFTGNDFSEGVRRIINNDLRLVKPTEAQAKQQLLISLYKKDVYRCILEKDVKGLLAWAANKDGRWRYIPFYDRKLFNACTGFLFKTFRSFAANKVKRAFGGGIRSKESN